MVITTVDVIDLRGGPKAPVLKPDLADPVIFFEDLVSDCRPVIGKGVSAAGCLPPHDYGTTSVLSGNGSSSTTIEGSSKYSPVILSTDNQGRLSHASDS